MATCDLLDQSANGASRERATFFDWDAYLADHGYLLLAGRVRSPAERKVVSEVIEAVFKRPVSESRYSPTPTCFGSIRIILNPRAF